MNLDGFEIKNPKCFLLTLTIGITLEISFLAYLYWNQ